MTAVQPHRFRSIARLFLILAGLVAFSATGKAQEARFFQSGGERIQADYYRAAGASRPRGAVIVLHGAGGVLFDGPEMRRVSERLAAAGNAVYLVHYFDRTHSCFFLGNSGMEKNFDTWLGTIHDAIRWVATQEKPARLGLYGYSLGAFLVVAAGAEHPEVAAVAEEAGGIWNNQTRRIGKLPPTLLIHGQADGRVPFAKYAVPLRETLRRRGTKVETAYYPEEGHGFSSTAQKQVRERVARFFAQHLR